MARDTSTYQIDGQRVLSVTEALQIAGLIDYSRVPPEILELARVRGEEIHQWLSLLVEELVKPGDEAGLEIEGYIRGYLRFRAETHFEPERCEHPVLNRTHRYAGTLDLAGRLNGGGLVVIDYKSTATEQPSTGPQLAAYEACLEERHERFGLYLRPDATYRLVRYSDRHDMHDFLAALRVAYYRLRHGLARLSED